MERADVFWTETPKAGDLHQDEPLKKRGLARTKQFSNKGLSLAVYLSTCSARPPLEKPRWGRAYSHRRQLALVFLLLMTRPTRVWDVKSATRKPLPGRCPGDTQDLFPRGTRCIVKNSTTHPCVLQTCVFIYTQNNLEK